MLHCLYLFLFLSVFVSIIYQYNINMYIYLAPEGLRGIVFTLSVCLSVCLYACFFIVLHIEEKHSTTIVKYGLSNTNYGQNTYLFMTYYPEPFHVRLLYGLLLKEHFQ